LHALDHLVRHISYFALREVAAGPAGADTAGMDTASVHPGWVRRALVALGVLVLLTAAGLLSPRVESGRAEGEQPEIVPGELVVTFTPNATDRHEEKAVARTGGEVEQRIESIDGVVISVEPDQTDITLKRLSRERFVQHVEPNFVVRAARLPNDRSFGEQWGLRNLGEFGGKVGADISASSAWDVAIGGPAPVAVVDTGVSFKHVDLSGNAWVNPGDPPNGLDDDGDGFKDDVHGADFLQGDSDPDDDGGHGTHVAGIIGAQGNNSVGIAGVNWESQVMGLKFLDENGEGNTADAANAIDFAVDHGARVINASWGGPAFSHALYSAIRRAHEHGVLVVAAAGNDGLNSDSSPDYPAAFDLPNVISVAATDRSDRLLDFSNYGAKSVDLAAPGDDVYSTVPPSSDPSGYAAFSGTSMAAPFVAGAAALYLSKFPEATVDQVRAALLGAVDPLPSLAGKTVTGGRINLAKALGAASPSTRPQRDTTPPSTFALIRPRNRLETRKRGLRFAWQRSRDASGIRLYRLYVNGKRVRTLRDKDGPGGRDPKPRTRFRLRGGKHRWFVRAYDYAGNRRTSRAFKRTRGSRKSSVLYVQKRKSGKRHSR
jgi:subtilisin family serine protease